LKFGEVIEVKVRIESNIAHDQHLRNFLLRERGKIHVHRSQPENCLA
jgi:hypothetical protein